MSPEGFLELVKGKKIRWLSNTKPEFWENKHFIPEGLQFTVNGDLEIYGVDSNMGEKSWKFMTGLELCNHGRWILLDEDLEYLDSKIAKALALEYILATGRQIK